MPSVSWEVNITSIISAIGPLIAVIGIFFETRFKVNGVKADNEELSAQIKDLQERMSDREIAAVEFKLTVSESYTRKEDLQKTEDRIMKRMDNIEHEMRQIPMRIAGLINRKGSGNE